jgi:CubicO group peptidase (beta-lactamase class C family)
MRTKITAWFLLCLLIAICGCSRPDPIREVANYLDELNTEGKFSGAVLIAKDGEPVFERAYGIANRNYDVPNQTDTKFNLGSMNKMFTAVTVLQLVEGGKIAVEDMVGEHLPEYPNQEVADKVTIHQLLTHTSGMGDIISQEWLETSNDRYKTLEDHLPLFVDHPLLFEPGSRGSYSNAGFIVLGLIVEATTGGTYYDYVKENIYQPCRMTDTDSYETDRIVPNIAIGYAGNLRNYGDLASNFYWLPFKGNSEGGGYSTAGEMLGFSNCLMGHQLLSPEFTELLLEEKADSPVPGWDGKYAYGFMVSVVDNHRVVGHGGSLPGACANLDIVDDLGYTVVILSNSSHDCVRVIIKTREVLLN